MIKELIKIHLKKINELEKYVILKKDDKGYYIEYAFTEGAPHDNRCLSWYHSYQENAYIRNGWFKDLNEEETQRRLSIIKADRDAKVGKLFRLSSFSCGYEEYPEESLERSKESWEKYHRCMETDEPFIPENHICRVGCPAKNCRKIQCAHWTYDEPVKCACWCLKDETTIEDFIKNYKITINANDLLRYVSSIDEISDIVNSEEV